MLPSIHTINCFHRGTVSSAACSLCWSKMLPSFMRFNGIMARTRAECVQECAITENKKLEVA